MYDYHTCFCCGPISQGVKYICRIFFNKIGIMSTDIIQYLTVVNPPREDNRNSSKARL